MRSAGLPNELTQSGQDRPRSVLSGDRVLPVESQAFHPRRLQTASRYLEGDAGTLDQFVRSEFPDLHDPRDRDAAALALHQAVHEWLPRTTAGRVEAQDRAAVQQAVGGAAAVEHSWQGRVLTGFMPADAGSDAALQQVEDRLDVERLLRQAALPADERALLLTLAWSEGGWASVRRQCLPT